MHRDHLLSGGAHLASGKIKNETLVAGSANDHKVFFFLAIEICYMLLRDLTDLRD